MINVKREENLASKLDEANKNLEDIIKDYDNAILELNKNNTNSAKKYTNEILTNKKSLNFYKKKINEISSTIK